MIRNLSELIEPADEDELIDHFVRKQFLHIAGDPSRLSELVGLVDIDAILSTGALRPPRVRVYRSGNMVPEQMYCTEAGEVSPPALQELLRKGASLVVDKIGQLIPGLARLEQAIERRLLGNTSINAYLTFNKGSAFAAHFDSHDVIIVQVHGEKHWEFFGEKERPSISLCKDDFEGPGPENVVWERTLRQGDILFVPRGTWHRATIQDGGFSFHLTITIVSLTGADFADWLFERAQTDDLIAQDLPRAGGVRELRDHGQRLRARIAELLEESDFDQYLAAMDGKRKINAGYGLSRTDVLLTSDVLLTALRRPFALRDNPTALAQFQAGGQTQRLSPTMIEVLRAIDAADEGITLGDVVSALAPALGSDALEDAVSRLAQKGLIAIASGSPGL